MTAREWTKDVYKGVGLFVSLNYKVLVHNYVFVTLGSCVVLALLYATNIVIKQIKIEFPASVALMLLLYVFLLVSQSVLGHARTSMIVKYVEIPANFALKWINMFFIPAFVTLPLADKISVKEAFIIGAVFVVGYVAMFVAIAYLVKLVQIITGNKSGRDLEPSDMAPTPGAQSVSELSVEEIALDTVAAHLDYPAPTAAVAGAGAGAAAADTSRDVDVTRQNTAPSDTFAQIEEDLRRESLQRQQFTQYVAQLPERSKKISQHITVLFDWLVFGAILVAGIPVYFVCDHPLFLHLGISVLLFKLALLFPPKWKKIMHPILVSFPFMLLLIYLFSLMKGDAFLDSIRQYKTERTYLELFNPSIHVWPGAGDVLSAMMDISIVSLSLPMFHYRKDLKRHYIAFFPPIIFCVLASSLSYPPICRGLGIAPSRSIGFVGRSVTLALGTPLMKSLNGSVPLMSVSTILSGILGVLVGDIFLKFLRIKDDDFLTIGITLGVNCGAISTAHLLINNPRAAAISSLSFSIFGTIMVILAAIRPFASFIQGLAGM